MKDRRTEKLYTRLTPEDDEQLRVKCARLHISKPDAAEIAIRQWLSGELSRVISSRQTEENISSKSNQPYNADQNIQKWLEITARVLNHPKPGLAEALKSNLVQFRDTAELWEGVHGRKNAAADDRGAGEPVQTDPIAEELDRGRRIIDEIAQRTNALEKTEEKDHEGEKRPPRPRRTGG